VSLCCWLLSLVNAVVDAALMLVLLVGLYLSAQLPGSLIQKFMLTSQRPQ
jgi:hypothetical protein